LAGGKGAVGGDDGEGVSIGRHNLGEVEGRGAGDEMKVLMHQGNTQNVYKSAKGSVIWQKQRLASSEKFAAQNVMTVPPGPTEMRHVYHTISYILFHSFLHHESLKNKHSRQSCMLIAY